MFAIIAEQNLIEQIELLLENKQWTGCNEIEKNKSKGPCCIIYGLVKDKVFNISPIFIGEKLYRHDSNLIHDNDITVNGSMVIDGVMSHFITKARKCASYNEALAYLCEVSLLQ